MIDHHISSALMGATAMASFIAMLFFLKFWRHTRDSFFLFFAAAFAVDAVGRLILAMVETSSDTEPVSYLSRLVTYGLIVVAIVQKNRSKQAGK